MNKKCMLIVEDEYWIRKSICNMAVNIFEGNIQIMESNNGEEALDILMKNKISFVLTDINMPFMDGITLISHVTKMYPDIPIFVLSGYSDFHLVRDALTGGALDYLLKPVKEKEFREVIRKAEKLIQINEETQRQKDIYDNYIRDLIMSNYICQKESGGIVYSKEKVKECFKKVFFPTYMAVIQINMKENVEEGKESVLEKRYKRKNDLKEWLDSSNYVYVENAYRLGEYIVFSSESIEKLERKCLKLKAIASDEENNCYSFRICVSEKMDCMEDIQIAYKEMILKIISNAEYGERFQYFNLRGPDRKNNITHSISEELENEINQAFQKNSREMTEYLLFRKLGIDNIEKWSFLEIKQVFSQLRTIVHSYYNRKLGMEEMWEVDNLFDSIEASVIYTDTGEINELMLQLISALFPEENGEPIRFVQQTDNIGKVVEYIGRHYTENLTLSSLAEKFYLTPSYLSRIFKKQTGKNLVVYITEKRLNKAMDYMKAGERSLTEIAFLVGYDDYSYFNKVFRRYMGISPKQYREDFVKGKKITSIM